MLPSTTNKTQCTNSIAYLFFVWNFTKCMDLQRKHWFFKFCLVSCLLSLISMNFGVYIGSFGIYVGVKYEWSELMFFCVVVFISLFGMFENRQSLEVVSYKLIISPFKKGEDFVIMPN